MGDGKSKHVVKKDKIKNDGLGGEKKMKMVEEGQKNKYGITIELFSR
jgi:hypothetical protein